MDIPEQVKELLKDKSWHLTLAYLDDTDQWKSAWLKPTGCDGQWVHFAAPEEYLTMTQCAFKQNAALLPHVVLGGKARFKLKIERNHDVDNEWRLGSFILGWDCGTIKDRVMASGIMATYHHKIMLPRTNNENVEVDHILEWKQWKNRKWFQEALPFSVSQVQFISLKVHLSNFAGGEQPRQSYYEP